MHGLIAARLRAIIQNIWLYENLIEILLNQATCFLRRQKVLIIGARKVKVTVRYKEGMVREKFLAFTLLSIHACQA